MATDDRTPSTTTLPVLFTATVRTPDRADARRAAHREPDDLAAARRASRRRSSTRRAIGCARAAPTATKAGCTSDFSRARRERHGATEPQASRISLGCVTRSAERRAPLAAAARDSRAGRNRAAPARRSSRTSSPSDFPLDAAAITRERAGAVQRDELPLGRRDAVGRGLLGTGAERVRAARHSAAARRVAAGRDWARTRGRTWASCCRPICCSSPIATTGASRTSASRSASGGWCISRSAAAATRSSGWTIDAIRTSIGCASDFCSRDG